MFYYLNTQVCRQSKVEKVHVLLRMRSLVINICSCDFLMALFCVHNNSSKLTVVQLMVLDGKISTHCIHLIPRRLLFIWRYISRCVQMTCGVFTVAMYDKPIIWYIRTYIIMILMIRNSAIDTYRTALY